MHAVKVRDGCVLLVVVAGAGGARSPVAIAEVPAEGRRLPALTQPEVLHALMSALEVGQRGQPLISCWHSGVHAALAIVCEVP